MTKKFLVPLLVAPLILSGCGNNKKALKPFEKGDDVLTAELVKALAGEPEERVASISEENTATPEGYSLTSTSLGMINYLNADGKKIILSAYNGKEIFNFDTTKIDSYNVYPFEEFLLNDYGYPTAGYSVLDWTEGEAPNEVYKSKAVDSFGNVLYDWSGTDVAEVPVVSDFIFEGSYSDFSCLKFTQKKDFHNTISYKVYSEDYSSLEDVEYLPGSGESISYIDTEFEKDGKKYRVDMDTEKLQFEIYQVTDKGDKLVKTMTLPDRSTWAVDSYDEAMIVYSEYSYVVVTDRVVPADAIEWTYLAPAAVSYTAGFEGAGDTEGDFSGEVTGSYVVPGLTEKHLQEVHVYDLYEMEETSVASAYVIESLDDSGLADLELDEDLLADPYLFTTELTEVGEDGFPTGVSHMYLVDDNFGLHDEIFTPQSLALYGLMLPFGDNYIANPIVAYFGMAADTIYDANLKAVKSIPGAFTVKDVVGDYAIVSSKDLAGNTAYALMDSDAKLVTAFEFSVISSIDDTHFAVSDMTGVGSGVLDMSKGSVKWFDEPYATDALFKYYQVGEGDNVKYEAYFQGVLYFKDAAVSEGEPVLFAKTSNFFASVKDPLGNYVKYGFKSLREGTTDVYDIHWFKVSI